MAASSFREWRVTLIGFAHVCRPARARVAAPSWRRCTAAPLHGHGTLLRTRRLLRTAPTLSSSAPHEQLTWI